MYRKEFLLGGMFGFICVGPLTDLVGQGVYLYTVYFGCHLVNILLVLAGLVTLMIVDQD